MMSMFNLVRVIIKINYAFDFMGFCKEEITNNKIFGHVYLWNGWSIYSSVMLALSGEQLQRWMWVVVCMECPL